MKESLSLQELGIKDLEHVVIKAKGPQDYGAFKLDSGEPLLYFDHIQVAQLTEYVRQVAARGGWRNMSRVVWEDRDDVKFVFSNGTINPISLNLLMESNMIIKPEEVFVPYMEICQVEELPANPNKGYITLSHVVEQRKPIFIKTVEYSNLHSKISEVTIHKPGELKKLDSGRIKEVPTELELPGDTIGKTVAIDYYFKPNSDTVTYTLSQERVANLYTLEATFYMKDENTGDLRTGILEMPKVYIMSNIDLRMGERASPTVGSFEAVAMPEYDDYKDEAVLCRITYIDSDIYSL